MKPVPAFDSSSIRRQCEISFESRLVSARMMIESGHIAWTHVWTANTLCHAADEVWVVIAKGKCPRALICSVLEFAAAKIRQGMQAWRVGVVHDQRVPEAVNLKCINLAVHGVVHDGIARDCGIQLVRQPRCIAGQILIPENANRKMLELAERDCSKEVRGNEKREQARII